MADLWSEFTEKLGGLAGRWTAYAAFGSFLLYLFGYLTLRFQLSTFGVATNLDIFDEKYLFAGCRFLVYLVSSVPNILIVVLILAALGYIPYRLIPLSVKEALRKRIADWSAKPIHLPLLGIVLAVVFIQFASRKCFVFGNVLLRKHLPDEWLSSVLLTNEARLSLYFSALLAGTLLTGVILLLIQHGGASINPLSRILTVLLIFLFAVEFLLLPANYGVLVSTQELPRIVEGGGAGNSPAGLTSWLVWESKDALIYFVRGPEDQRMLVTVPRKDTRISVVAYDNIFCVLFGANQAGSSPCQR
jgi:hypothetical protein